MSRGSPLARWDPNNKIRRENAAKTHKKPKHVCSFSCNLRFTGHTWIRVERVLAVHPGYNISITSARTRGEPDDISRPFVRLVFSF